MLSITLGTRLPDMSRSTRFPSTGKQGYKWWHTEFHPVASRSECGTARVNLKALDLTQIQTMEPLWASFSTLGCLSRIGNLPEFSPFSPNEEKAYILELGLSFQILSHGFHKLGQSFPTLTLFALPPTVFLPASGLSSTGAFSSQLPQCQGQPWCSVDDQISLRAKQQSRHLLSAQPLTYSNTVIKALASIWLALSVFAVQPPNTSVLSPVHLNSRHPRGAKEHSTTHLKSNADVSQMPLLSEFKDKPLLAWKTYL